MRHRKVGKKLGRKTEHREATRSNMIVSLFRHERIETTVEKAKYFRIKAEKMITLAKGANLAATDKTERAAAIARYRRAIAELQDKTVCRKLFTELGPRFKDRAGGYTRILRLGRWRIGDGASRAILELVDNKVLEQQIAKAEQAATANAGKK